ncbi:hypothetical protein E1B28_007216 [Marasmius oreades]|uniref:2'-phosphotransferase n=1 Tax=Marasmius oreades TaxID=181124 RepID=A0A9P7S2I9_9AGAR|nr:uncharacterized protein E1B28_007216 [Marasmius oreades]KAG7093546.1 hypothetical protein E1B28_007216 [Marasmius oreades]
MFALSQIRPRPFGSNDVPAILMRSLTTNRAHKHRRLGGGIREDRPTPSQNAQRVRLSKTISWLLRHGAEGNGLPIRSDGFVKVKDLLKTAELRELDFTTLEKVVEMDEKQRFTISYEPHTGAPGSSSQLEHWWIRANQGHSLTSVVDLELKRLKSPEDVPMAIHGTSAQAWKTIATEGLSRKSRNHIHLAQGLIKDGIISGTRSGVRVLIYIDLEKAMSDGIKFYLSSNGVVLTEGENGILKPKYFRKVETLRKTYQPMPGWEGNVDDNERIQDFVNGTDEPPPVTSARPPVKPTPQTNNGPHKIQDGITFL